MEVMKRSRLLLLLLLAAVTGAHGQAVLRKGDVFELRMSGMPLDQAQEFGFQYTVGEDGRVSLPYVGAVPAAGMTTTEVARTIERRLVAEKIFTAPTAIVNLPSGTLFVTVGGKVKSAQAVPWASDLSLSAAITRAGGPDDFGHLNNVRLTRDGKTHIFDLTKAEIDANQNPRLRPGDEIAVR